MGKPLSGYINLTKLIDAGNNGHSAFYKSDKGEVLVNVTLWENDKADNYGNTIALQLNPAKDSGHAKDYFGNFKPTKAKDSSVKPGEIGGVNV